MIEKIDGRRKYTLDIDAFIQDSHEKYYWLGLIATDGNVAKSEARIRIELKDDDEEILINLLKFCKSNSPITYRTNNNKCKCACATINSAKLKRYLAEYNIVPNKTKTFTIPLDKIPQEYIWDFVRGMMDGDGCITLLNHQKYNPYGISFVSANLQCVEQMKEIWGIDNKISEIRSAYIIQKYGKGCIPILNKIYENSTETSRLKRKYLKYRSIIEESIIE